MSGIVKKSRAIIKFKVITSSSNIFYKWTQLILSSRAEESLHILSIPLSSYPPIPLTLNRGDLTFQTPFSITVIKTVTNWERMKEMDSSAQTVLRIFWESIKPTRETPSIPFPLMHRRGNLKIQHWELYHKNHVCKPIQIFHTGQRYPPVSSMSSWPLCHIQGPKEALVVKNLTALSSHVFKPDPSYTCRKWDY